MQISNSKININNKIRFLKTQFLQMNKDKNSFNMEKTIKRSCKTKKEKNLSLMMASNKKSQINQTISI